MEYCGGELISHGTSPKPSHNEKNALFQNYVFMVTFRGEKKNGFSLFSLVAKGCEMSGNDLGLEHILTRFPLFSFLHCTLFLFKMQLSIGGRLTEPWSILTETRSEQLTEKLKND